MTQERRESIKYQLWSQLRQYLSRDMYYKDMVIYNPYKETINDIVEYVALFNKESLYPYTALFIMTDDSVIKNIGSGKKYIWYRTNYTISFAASLILEDILEHNGNNLRIKTKLKQYYNEALSRLLVDSAILDSIKREEIVTMSN